MSTVTTVTFPQAVELKYSRKARNEDIIRIDTQEKVFHIDRKRLSLSSQVKLSDPNGTIIYEMKELFTWRDLNGVFSGANPEQKLFTFQKKSDWTDSNRTILIWNGEREGDPVMKVEGNYELHDYRVKMLSTDQIVASVSRTSTTVEFYSLDEKDFLVKIQPEQDAALLLLAVIAFERQHYDAKYAHSAAASGAGAF